jgi:hypothetical protein
MEPLAGRGVPWTARVAAIALATVAVTACAPPPEPVVAVPTTAESYEFVGTWNASGSRRTIPFGEGRTSSTFDLKGTIILVGASRPGIGFLCETIALVDTASGLVGRSVWTDEHGDKVFSELTGEGTAAKNRIEGVVVGGTGRYTGATGTYAYRWQYVVEAEEGVVQGRAVELKGRVQLGPSAAGGKP